MRIYIETEPQIKAPRVTPLEGVSTYALRGIRVRGVENPQGFGIDERRLIDSNIQHIFAANADSNLFNLPQRAQRLILHSFSEIENRLRTRMTRIGRIFTDPCVSAQSAFYRCYSSVKNSLSSLICVDPRLINCVGGS